MANTSLLEIRDNAKPAEQLLAGLKPADGSRSESTRAGENLVAAAKDARLSVEDYLRLAVDPSKGEFVNSGLDGFECALAYLDLPIRNDYSKGIVLQAASETFNTFPGTRALFRPVVDNVLQWAYRQQQFETTESIVSQSRVITGTELISTVVNDNPEDYQQTGVIAEGANVPVRSIRTSERSVKFYKFGGAIEFTYEFERRAGIELLLPYAARMEAEVKIGEVAMATALILNGDGINGAAPLVTASALAASFPAGGAPVAVAGRLNWEILLKWLVQRAQAGVPVDTIIGNWDMYLEWQRMFATPTQNQGLTQIEILQKAGVQMAALNPRLPMNINFALSSTAPANKLIGITKGWTLEELVENGSDIEETQRTISNQKVKLVKTTNKGYRLVYGDTRSVLELNA
jgi:hypothetical protein